MGKIKRAIISVSDKQGVVEFAGELAKYGVEILSTGGTAALLRKSGIDIKEVAEYTGFPEMLDGRVKTLHPKIHGGLLGQRDKPEHRMKMEEEGIEPIDLIVVNLYPFEETIAREGTTLEEAIENIDIGGPTMLRSAAKNYRFVTVITDPEDYGMILNELQSHGGKISETTNFNLAKKVFRKTAGYDGAISNYLGSLEEGRQLREFPETLSLQFTKLKDLRYGENPHQNAAFYREKTMDESSIPGAAVLQGKELSYNNIMDLDAALETVKEFHKPTAVIIKHSNPCGVATSENSLMEAYIKARECDPISAFGGVVSFNRPVDQELAGEIISIFVEAVIAPGYDEGALEVFKSKKDLRVLQISLTSKGISGELDMRKVPGGILVQNRDLGKVDINDLEVVTKRKPSPEELAALNFAWKVCKHVKSNAIVYTVQNRTVGIGAGQMSRVDSSKIAVIKANTPVKGTVMASDAMFPFRDGVDVAAEAGATAIIQPGGSIRDKEVISAADEHGMAMIFTRMRHFRH